MKKSVLLAGVLIISVFKLAAVPDTLYNKANRLYQEGKYEESVDAYGSVISAGYESATLYYNLGNAFFRSNKLGKARLYYEKALKLNPSDEDSQANLTYLQTLLADKFDEVPVIFFKKWFKTLLLSFSSNQWAYMSMFSFILSVTAISIFLLFRSVITRKSGFYSSLIFLILCIFTLAASRQQYHIMRTPDSAIVTDLSVNAKSAPRETGTGLFVLHEGAKVILEDKTSGWQEIRLSDGRKGWVPEGSIESI